MKGKQRCKILKDLRRQIAEQNDIAYVTSECKHKGDCRGTCPKCESEVRYLERELEKRVRLGKAVTVVGLAAGITFASAGCAPFDNIRKTKELDGDMLPSSQISSDEGGNSEIETAGVDITGDMPVIDDITMGAPIFIDDATDGEPPIYDEYDEIDRQPNPVPPSVPPYIFTDETGTVIFTVFPTVKEVLNLDEQKNADAFLASLSRDELQKRWHSFIHAKGKGVDVYSEQSRCITVYYDQNENGSFSHATYTGASFGELNES